MASSRKSTPEEVENVSVFVRIRPLSKREVIGGQKNVIAILSEDNVLVLQKVGEDKSKVFKFDHVFGTESTQMDLYRRIAFPIVENVLKGYHGTIFAYGQTGTGKTYTMAGEPEIADLKGIIPNAFSHIFSHISRESEEKSFAVTVTYLEIYNEEVRDLLAGQPHKRLEVRERTDVGVYVKDLLGFSVHSIDSITNLMSRGNTNRMTRSTLMNDVSSRSHAIFTITIEAKDSQDKRTTKGTLNLVDLAGSERLSRTHATGERLREAANINQSLSVLGNVISALVDGKSMHIPYRNSKLTRLLQNSLGGNSKTAMIAMISPAQIDFDETLCTLRYASRVKLVKNTAKVNVETNKGLIECFEQEIAKLQQRLSSISIQEERLAAKEEKRKREKIDEEEQRDFYAELQKAEEEKNALLEKISIISKKILVGGEKLLEIAKNQEFMKEQFGTKLQKLDQKSKQLEEELKKKGKEKLNIAEDYSNLQEEGDNIMTVIKLVCDMLSAEKMTYSENEHEYQREMEGLYHNHRLIMREVQLAHLMVESYIPSDYMKLIEAKMQWNTVTDEYQLKGVAYTGNNMRNRTVNRFQLAVPGIRGMKNVYHKYDSQGQRIEKRIRASSVPRASLRSTSSTSIIE